MERLFVIVRVLVAILALLGGSTSCALGRQPTPLPEGLGQVHDLVSTGDGAVLIASHAGVYRLDPDGGIELRGDQRHDLTSMASDSDGELIASGHPDPNTPGFSEDGLPSFLGLSRSTDVGATWQPAELLGRADFHALAVHKDGLFAAETAGRIWFRNPSGDWERRGAMEARDLAVNPGDSQQLVAVGNSANIWVSSDGARTWGQVVNTPSLVEVEWVEEGTLVGVTFEGGVWTAANPAGTWTQIGEGPVRVEALHAAPDSQGVWAATRDGEILAMRSDGVWETIFSTQQPP